MKAFRISITVVSLVLILIFSGCGPKPGPSESTQDKQLGLLSKTWKISSVTLGTVPQTNWTGFQLTITGTKGQTTFNYSCASRPTLSPWPAGGGANGLGTWVFGADPVTQIIRDKGTADELTMTYTVDAASTSLVVSFSYTGNGYTRVSNVSGSWVFTFQ